MNRPVTFQLKGLGECTQWGADAEDNLVCVADDGSGESSGSGGTNWYNPLAPNEVYSYNANPCDNGGCVSINPPPKPSTPAATSWYDQIPWNQLTGTALSIYKKLSAQGQPEEVVYQKTAEAQTASGGSLATPTWVWVAGGVGALALVAMLITIIVVKK